MHSACKLSCILLSIVCVNRRRGQLQGDWREEVKPTANKPIERARQGRRSSGDGLRPKMHSTVRARAEGAGGGRGDGVRAPGGRTLSKRAQR